MKAMLITAALVFLWTIGPAVANPPDDPQAAFVIDLSPAGGPTYYIHCPHNADLSNCPEPSVWEEANGLHALQTQPTLIPTGQAPADSQLLSA
jgi:hypothetical protein